MPATEQVTTTEQITRWHERDEKGQSRRDRTLDSIQSALTQSGEHRIERDLSGIKLIGAQLAGVDFSDCDLSGADLSGAHLQGATFVRTDLAGATLHGADLTRCEFAGANLTGAHLGECTAIQAGFGKTSLRGADLFDADFSHASFIEADLESADLHAAKLHKSRLRGANLRYANLARADLSGCDLEDSNVDASVFHKADLRGASVRGVREYETASFIETDIRDVNFSAAHLLRRHINDQNYIWEFRHRSRFNHLLYYGWWATSNCGRSLLRWAVLTAVITIVFGFLYTMVAIDYGTHPTAISSFYFSLVTLTSLGYGDVVPASMTAQIVAMAEVVLGYLMLGGLISILATKMARRAD